MEGHRTLFSHHAVQAQEVRRARGVGGPGGVWSEAPGPWARCGEGSGSWGPESHHSRVSEKVATDPHAVGGASDLGLVPARSKGLSAAPQRRGAA